MRLFFLLFIVVGTFCYSQNFTYKAKLPNIDSSAYYNILLTPEITSKLNSNFSDIRIYDDNRKEIAFIFLNTQTTSLITKTFEFQILASIHQKLKKLTQLIIYNPNKSKVENILLIVQKPKVYDFQLMISGSDDQKNWNVIKNVTTYLLEKSDSAYSELRITALPATNFKYYKIIIYDNNKINIKVKSCFNFRVEDFTNESYIKLPQPTIEQFDNLEEGKTILTVKFNEPHYLDKLIFYISEPKIYYRKAEIYHHDTLSGRKINIQFLNQTKKFFYLSSDTVNEIVFSKFFAKEFYVLIFNNDNTPLKIAKVEAFQLKNYLVAYLKAKHSYELNFGNSAVRAPLYDLKFFIDKIPSFRKEITPYSIEKIKFSLSEREKKLQITETILWVIFIFVIVILAFITIKLYISSKKSENDNIAGTS